jgi:orotidine-5'-phosphate decarboxylase
LDFSTHLKAATGGRIGLCVGLDPIPDRLPSKFKGHPEPLAAFNAEIIEATSAYASAYKPNLAFYERFGADGWIQLGKTVMAIPKDKIVILDAKRGDIGSTAEAYADALFNGLGGDAATVSPYLGSDSLEPFLVNPDHGAYILAVTSNKGGADLQELTIDGEPLYRHVIRLARRLNKNRNVGLVVGATRTELWPGLLELALDLPLLVPGVGAQGGDPVVLRSLLSGYPGAVLVNSSRGIIHASSGDDFALRAGEEARKLSDQLAG